jgi:nicotinamidase-related amidase
MKKNYEFQLTKRLGLLLMVLLYAIGGRSQTTNNPMKTALLIVDIQKFYFPGEGPGLYHAEEASLAAKEVLEIFSERKQLVVHVRHKSTKGFEIHPNVAPLGDEKVITKEEVNSFYKTDLLDYLKKNNINRLVIIGMQTQMCLEGAVRAAHDYGFECIVVQDACATRDVNFGGRTVKAEDVQTAVLATLSAGRYADIIDLKSFKDNTDRYLFLQKNQVIKE